MRMMLYEEESWESGGHWDARSLVFQVDQSLILTGLVVRDSVQVLTLQIFMDHQLIYTGGNVDSTATELPHTFDISLLSPVHCLPAHLYTVSLTVSPSPSSSKPRAGPLVGPSASQVQVLQWDCGQIRGLKLLAEKVNEGEKWLQECMWRLWEGPEGGNLCSPNSTEAIPPSSRVDTESRK
jgi:hypothetical protein